MSRATTADHPNVAIIKRYYEAYGKGDIATVQEIFAPDIVWQIPGHHPLSGPKQDPSWVLAEYRGGIGSRATGRSTTTATAAWSIYTRGKSAFANITAQLL